MLLRCGVEFLLNLQRSVVFYYNIRLLISLVGLLWSPWVSYTFLSIFFPRLISAAADWMSAVLRPHIVWP